MRPRKLVVLFLAIPAFIAGVAALGLSNANAAGPELVARADCLGSVTFTATEQGTDDSSVVVEYSTDDSATFVAAPKSGSYQFDATDSYAVSDNFQLPATVARPSRFNLRTIAAGQTTDIPVAVPAMCAQPTAVVTVPTCAAPIAQVALNNASNEAVEFRIYRDDANVPLQTTSVSAGTKTVSVPVTSAYLLSIHIGNSAIIKQQLTPPTGCSANTAGFAGKQPVGSQSTKSIPDSSTTVSTTSTTAPSASVASTPGLSAGCSADATGWTITFDNSLGATPLDYVVKDELGNNVDSVIVLAGAAITKQYPFANVQGDDVSIIVNGVVLATGSTKIQCVNVGATVNAACDTVAGNGALLGFTDTGMVSETFTVIRDGKAVAGSPFTLTPSQDVTQKLLPMINGTSADIRVTGNNGFVYEKVVALSCGGGSTSTQPPSVLGTNIKRSNLPFTGIDPWFEMTFAVVLVALGSTLLYARAKFAFAGRPEGVKSSASGLRAVNASLAKTRVVRSWFDGLVAPKGKHARRRRR